MRKASLTGIGIVKIPLTLPKHPINDRRQPLIELPRTIQQSIILPTDIILIRADNSLAALARTLQPTRVLTTRTRLRLPHRNDLVPVHRRIDRRSVGQNLAIDAHRRVEGLHERNGGLLQDIIIRRQDVDLALQHLVAIDAGDARAGVGGDVAGAVVLPALVDLAVTEVRQVRGREDLGRAVAVAVEHVDA